MATLKTNICCFFQPDWNSFQIQIIKISNIIFFDRLWSCTGCFFLSDFLGTQLWWFHISYEIAVIAGKYTWIFSWEQLYIWISLSMYLTDPLQWLEYKQMSGGGGLCFHYCMPAIQSLIPPWTQATIVQALMQFQYNLGFPLFQIKSECWSWS